MRDVSARIVGSNRAGEAVVMVRVCREAADAVGADQVQFGLGVSASVVLVDRDCRAEDARLVVQRKLNLALLIGVGVLNRRRARLREHPDEIWSLPVVDAVVVLIL